MEYSHKRRQNNTSSRISNKKNAVNSGAQDPAYQAYLQAVLAGRAKADSNTMGHRQDLAPSLAAKMSKAFGMDLSQMKLYRSNAMEGTETKGMASGNNIVLSKDIDLNTMAGQAVLGHEISHVRAQSQGIGMGHSGLYQNADLEHQADVEGMMAARGQSILGESTGMDMGLGMGGIGGLTPLGPGMSSSAGAPMQAKKHKKNKKSNAKTQKKAADQKQKASATQNATIDRDEPSYREILENDIGYGTKGSYENVRKTMEGEYAYGSYNKKCVEEYVADKFENKAKQAIINNNLTSNDNREGATVTRCENDFNFLLSDKNQEEFDQIVGDYSSKDPKKSKAAKMMIKERYHNYLKNLYKKYGTITSQLDMADIFNNAGSDFTAEIALGTQIFDDLGYNGEDEKHKQMRDSFSYVNNGDETADKKALEEKEKEFRTLAYWQDGLVTAKDFGDGTYNTGSSYAPDNDLMLQFNESFAQKNQAVKDLGLDGGKGLNPKQLKAYQEDLENRIKNGEAVDWKKE